MAGNIGSGKVAIVTGCSSGIGLATALLFVREGYKVFGVSTSNFDTKLLPVLTGDNKGAFKFHKGDLATPGMCDDVVALCVKEFGESIDVLANIAGILDNFTSAETFTDEEYDRVIAVNLTAPTKLIRATIPHMKAKKNGSIVNVCSKASISGAAAGVSYTASKHALLGVTKNTAWRFHDEGIRCNAVLPGAVLTNIATPKKQELWDYATLGTMVGVLSVHITMGTQPDIQAADIANAILFLSSDAARFINGAALPIDKAWGVI